MKISTIAVLGAMTFAIGCGSLLPEKRTISQSQWSTFESVKADFEKIQIGVTTLEELKGLGIDFETMPNTQQLTYIEVAQKFGMLGARPDHRIKIPPGVVKLVQVGERGKAYSLKVSQIDSKREGNFFMDWLRFKRTRHKTGWEYEVLVIAIDNTVEYVLYAGKANVDIVEKERNPLGPFQSLESGTIINAVAD